ncbi:MAG: cyclic pyranopterin phosphate synthase MoaA [Bacteroidetes bacterium 46-16]|nr:MAG: cyclic pyranopterin phosphate synthase MoaA [Bacteroidetes bacterium 46-16]
MILDSHGREINYLRLAVTDRCNLRCTYCMPHDGLQWLQRDELLTYEEMLRLCRLLVSKGISKIRITGGEPFARKDMMHLLTSLSEIDGLSELTLTTNGVLTAPFIPGMKKIGIRSVNLSLDTLDRERFLAITRRDELDKVLDTLRALLQQGMGVKINAVLMDGRNTGDIRPLVELAKDNAVSVRFIEEMPFNGDGADCQPPVWDHPRILQEIKAHFPGIYKIPDAPHATAYNYSIPGYKGTVGIIAAYTRSFCGSCDRIRITPQGTLKTCLYSDGGLSVRDLLRSQQNDELLLATLLSAINNKPRDGWAAEHSRKEGRVLGESMAIIGG